MIQRLPLHAFALLAIALQDPQPPQQPPEQPPQSDKPAEPPPAEAQSDEPAEQTPAQSTEHVQETLPPAPTSGTLELSLKEALDIALSNDLGLQLEGIDTEVARYNYVGSWGAFDPLATASAAFTDLEFEANSPVSGVSVIEEQTFDYGAGILFPLTTGGSFDLAFNSSYRETNNALQQGIDSATTDILGLAFRQPLLRGRGSDYATSRQTEADLAYRSQIEGFRQARQELLNRVHDTYWEVVASLKQLDVADTTLALGREQLQQNQRRLEAGVGTEVEVLQADANVARQIEQRLLREVAVRGAADRLKAVLFPGKDRATWDAEIVPTTPLPVEEDDAAPPWQAALVVALEQRPELRQQRFEIDASEVRLVRARSDRNPGLDLLLSSQARGFDADTNAAFQSAGSWEFPTNTAALSFSFPLGNRAASNAEKAARASVRGARLVYDQIESQIVAEVRQAVRQLQYSAEAVKAAEKSEELAQRQLAAEEARYREGLSTNFQVLEFQQQLAETRFTHTRARVEYAKALASLQKAEGVLGEIRP